MSTRSLRIAPDVVTPPPGRLRTADEIVAKFFTSEDGTPMVTPRWVIRHVRPRVRLTRGRIGFFDADVEQWIAKRRDAA